MFESLSELVLPLLLHDISLFLLMQIPERGIAAVSPMAFNFCSRPYNMDFTTCQPKAIDKEQHN